MPETSIVIRSFNESEYIEDVLEAVAAQQYRDFEVILVDSGSTDGTVDIARDYVDQVEFVDPRHFTFGYSLNVGCESADGEYVAFLSAHAIPTDEEWLGRMVAHFEDDAVAMVYSNQTGAGETKFSEDRLFDELFPAERKCQEPPEYFANNASSVIRRDLWEDHHFDEYLTGREDVEWAKHVMDDGYVVVYEPDSCIYHIHDETWQQVYTRFEREAIADREIGLKEPGDRWREYLAVPWDVFADALAAVRAGEVNWRTLANIARFRYNQHLGTARGLLKEPDLDSNRYEYFYSDSNERLVVQEPARATLEHAPRPKVRPNDALVDVEYVGVDRSDLRVFRGDGRDVTYPIVPGHEFVGTVVDVGANTDGVQVGDTVVGEPWGHCGLCSACEEGKYAACRNGYRIGVDRAGAFAQYLTLPSNHLHAVPPVIDAEAAPLTYPLARSLEGIRHLEPLIRDSVTCTVLGANPLGNLAARAFDRRGFETTVVPMDSDRGVPLPDGITQRDRIGDVEAAEVVVQTTTDETALERLVSGGSPTTTVLFLQHGGGEISVPLEGMGVETVSVVAIEEAHGEAFREALDLLRDLQVERLVGRTYSIDEYDVAFRNHERDGVLKTLVEPGDGTDQ